MQNTVRVNASAAGFASVWVDWNVDGDFADAGERVADAQPVTAGDNDLTFAGAANPADIRTYVRVRYSTDAASIHQPTGAAPDGEVEDYRVLVERLHRAVGLYPGQRAVLRDDVQAPLPADETGGDRPRYRDVTVVDGRAVDMFVERGGRVRPQLLRVSGDDAAWNVNGSCDRCDYTFFLAGTTTPVQVSGVWGVNDMDSGESTSYLSDPDRRLRAHRRQQGSVTTGVNSQSQAFTRFSGTVSGNSVPESRYQMWFQGRSTLSASWGGGTRLRVHHRRRQRPVRPAVVRRLRRRTATATRRCSPPTARTTRSTRGCASAPTSSSTATASRRRPPTATTPTAPTTRTVSPRRSP